MRRMKRRWGGRKGGKCNNDPDRSGLLSLPALKAGSHSSAHKEN